MATETIYYKHPKLTTGATISISIYYGGTLETSGSMTEIGNGLYYYSFTTSNTGQFMAYMTDGTYNQEKTFEVGSTTTNSSSASVTTILYCTASDVYRTAGIDSSVISEANVTEFIKEAEREVDRITNQTYWAEADNGTATTISTVTLTDSSQTWTDDEYIGNYVWIHKGTGSGQIRKITDNTATRITVGSAFSPALSTNSQYRLFHTGTEPYKEQLDEGDDTDTLFLETYPIHVVEFAASGGVSVSTSRLYRYDKIGKLVLMSNAEKNYWASTRQGVNVHYYSGVYPIPYNVKRLTMVIAAMKSLAAQAGGTFDDITSYSIPEFTASKGEPYTNIREAMFRLKEEAERLISSMTKYVSIY